MGLKFLSKHDKDLCVELKRNQSFIDSDMSFILSTDYVTLQLLCYVKMLINRRSKFTIVFWEKYVDEVLPPSLLQWYLFAVTHPQYYLYIQQPLNDIN